MNDCKYPRKFANNDGDFPHNDDYEVLIDSLLENNDLSIIPFTTLLQLNDLVPVYQSHCIRHREYSKAKKVYDLQTSITMEINKQTGMLKEYDKKAKITAQLATINSNQQKPSPLLTKFNDETKEKEKQILTRQSQVLKLFEEFWESKVHSEYCQESKRLKELKKEEKRLSESDPSRANEIRDEISHLEEEEADESQKTFEHDYETSKLQLFEKFDYEIAMFKQDRMKQKAMILSRIEKKKIIRPKTHFSGVSNSSYLSSSLSRNQSSNSIKKRSSNRSSYSSLSSHSSYTTSQSTSTKYDEASCQVNSSAFEGTSNKNTENGEEKMMFSHRDDYSDLQSDIHQSQPSLHDAGIQIEDDMHDRSIPYETTSSCASGEETAPVSAGRSDENI